jgi:hypothetical protein
MSDDRPKFDLNTIRVSFHSSPPPEDGSAWPEASTSTVYNASVWTAPTGGETVDGVLFWDASDPDAGPVFHFDAATGESDLTGNGITVIRFD